MPHIAYFCAPESVDTPFVRAYKVQHLHPYNVKALRMWAKSAGIGVPDIKKRGIEVGPEEMRKVLLAGAGKKARRRSTLLLTRIGERRIAIDVEPVYAEPASDSESRVLLSMVNLPRCGTIFP